MTKLNADYLALLERLPLRRICSDQQLDAAANVIEELSDRVCSGAEQSPGERDYFEAMTVLISDWKRRSPRIKALLDNFEEITEDGAE